MYHIQFKCQSAEIFALIVGNVGEIVREVFDDDINSCRVGSEEGVRKI